MFNVKKSDKPLANFLFTDDHIAALVKSDFLYKCYLCEGKTPRHLEVEHFYPQVHFPEKINDWDNLICICEKCNKIRPKNINTTTEHAVLNPCTDDVENLIQLKYNADDYSISITAADATTLLSNSINLLNRIHNGTNSSSLSFTDLRKLIALELAELEDEIYNLNTYRLENVFTKRIQKRLSRQSAFFAIKKAFIKENNPELIALLDQ